MAQVIGEAFSALSGPAISAISQAVQDKDPTDRVNQIGDIWSQMVAQAPGKIVIVAYTEADSSGCVNLVKTNVPIQLSSGTKLDFTAYIFDYGRFQLKGDGGSINVQILRHHDKIAWQMMKADRLLTMISQWCYPAGGNGFHKDDAKTLRWDKP